MNTRNTIHHLGLIMDGNGRWGEAQGKGRISGYAQGVIALHNIIISAPLLGIRTIIAFAFSRDNWKRDVNEVETILSVITRFVRRSATVMIENGIRFRWIGETDKLPNSMLTTLNSTSEITKSGSKMTLCLCINYSARAEMAHAVKNAVLSPPISDKNLMSSVAKKLYWPEMPNIDLIIRTSGERRLSDFCCWNSQYAKIHFTDTLWPDFSIEELSDIIKMYNSVSEDDSKIE